MASIAEVLKAAAANDETKTEFAQAVTSPEGLRAYLAAHGCDATLEELEAFANEKRGELSDEELEGVAGGWKWWQLVVEGVASVASVGGCLAAKALDIWL